eukprot:2471043-Amphidinium_carterae.1
MNFTTNAGRLVDWTLWLLGRELLDWMAGLFKRFLRAGLGVAPVLRVWVGLEPLGLIGVPCP